MTLGVDEGETAETLSSEAAASAFDASPVFSLGSGVG